MGAPWEYFNFENEMRFMEGRLQATSPQDYLDRVMQLRMTSNGVFGFKSHFRHFSVAIQRNPDLLERLSPLTYIYINRRDKLGQAVSMAKAYQTKSWTSLVPPNEKSMRYDTNHISACLREVEIQTKNWLYWFEEHQVTPYVVNYEDFVRDADTVVASLVDLLRCQDDVPDEIALPDIVKQGDVVNEDWKTRYMREAGH